MSDLISRKAAIKAIRKDLHADKDYMSAIICEGIEDVLNNLPSAESERKTGYWINAEYKDGTIAHKCSECKCLVGYSVSSLTWFNFCPWCGADMRGGEDE